MTSSKTSRGSFASSSAAMTASTVPGPSACPPSASPTSSSMTRRAWPTRSSSPSSVSRFPRRRMAQPRRSRRAWRMPSSTVASSAATSFETDRTSCNRRKSSLRPEGVHHGPGPPRTTTRVQRSADVVLRGARNVSKTQRLGELLAHELAHRRPVGAPRDLRHDVGHHAPEVSQRRRPRLRDRVVDDPLELFLPERLGHEFLDDGQLSLLEVGPLVAPAAPEGLRGLSAPLALALQHLQLLVLLQLAPELLLRRPQRGQRQPQRARPLLVARAHRVLELPFDASDQAHSNPPRVRPPSTCQCRWKIVWPAPRPTLTMTR